MEYLDSFFCLINSLRLFFDLMESSIVAVDASNPLADGGGTHPRMAALRRHRVRLDSLSRTTLACTVVTFFTFLGLFAVIGSNGPAVALTSAAGGADGASVALFDFASKCDTNPDGSIMSRINYCWSHDVDFETRFVQSFTLSFSILRRISNVNYLPEAHVPMKLAVDWFGYTPERGYFLIHSGNVSRTAHCYPSQLSCELTSVIKTVAIPVTKYHIRVYANPAIALSLSGNPVFAGSASFSIRVMNPLYAMYELGFKAFFLTVSLLALIYYSWMTGCMYCGMTCHLRTYDYIYKALKRCRSRRQNDGGQFSGGDQIFDGTSFAREQSTNWVQALLVALVLFNEPLLWARYYYPNDGANLAYLSVAGQLTFLAILLAYFLVEFGLLAAYANFENTVTPCRFYAPKFFWVFVYWAMSMSVYAWLITQQQKDPLFDWAEFIYNTSFTAKSGAGPGGSEAENAQLFFLYWSSILATLYLLYLTWLILRACASIMKFSLGTRVVFSLHLLVIFSAALGISAGVIYSTEIDTALNLTYFNALFNAYILTLSWLYSPSAYVDLEAQVVDDQRDRMRIDGQREEEEGEDDVDESSGRDKSEERGREEKNEEEEDGRRGFSSSNSLGPGTPYRGDSDANKGQSDDFDTIVKPGDIEIDAKKKSAAEDEEEDLGLTLRSQRVRRLSETATSRGEGNNAQTSKTILRSKEETQLDPKLASVFNFTSPAAKQQQQSTISSSVPPLFSAAAVATVVASFPDKETSSLSDAGLPHLPATSQNTSFDFDDVGISASSELPTSSTSLSAHHEVDTAVVESKKVINDEEVGGGGGGGESKTLKVLPTPPTAAAFSFDDLFGSLSSDNTRTFKAVVLPVGEATGVVTAASGVSSNAANVLPLETSSSAVVEAVSGSASGEEGRPSGKETLEKSNNNTATAPSNTLINPFDDDGEKDPFESFNDF